MIAAILPLILGVWSAAGVVSSLRPTRWEWFLLPSLLWSWVVIELPA